MRSARVRRGIGRLAGALWFAAALGAVGLPLGSAFGPTPAWAVQPEEQLADPALEARARALSKELRCVVCDNQSIDDSDAQVAGDMRRFVRERITAGESDAEIRDAMVAFYGEYVLLRPRFSLQNALIWATPVLALGLGLAWVLRRMRPDIGRPGARALAAEAEAGASAPAPLSPEEEEELRRLLAVHDAPSKTPHG